MKRKIQIAAIAFMFALLISMTAFAQVQPASKLESQTRTLKPQAMNTPSTINETDVATGPPTYFNGTSVGGSYLDTQQINYVYHSSEDAYYPPNTYVIDLYYPFRFVGANPNSITAMSWSARVGVSLTTGVHLYNWITSSWDLVGFIIAYGPPVLQEQSANFLYYVNANNGSMRLRLAHASSAYTDPYVDYLAFTITHYIPGAPNYGSAIATANPTYVNGSLTAGGIWQTWMQNNSYQVSTGGYWDTGVPDAGTTKAGTWTDWNAVGALAWANNPNSAHASDNIWTWLDGAGYSHYLKGVGFGFAVGGSTLSGVKVSIERHELGTSTNAFDVVVSLLKAGVVTGDNKAATGTEWPTTDGVATYGGPNILWNAGLTIADVNDANFGMVLQCKIDANTAYVDYISITVYMSVFYYGLNVYYQMQFTATSKANVYQLGWLVNGKVSGNAATIYLYNWVGSTWDNSTQKLTSTQGDRESSSISVANYMAANGSVLIMFYLANQAASFTLSVDFMETFVIYVLTLDTTPPSAPILVNPGNGTIVDPYLVSFSWLNSTSPSGISYYHIQVSTDAAFSSLYLDKTTYSSSYLINTTTPLLFQWYYWRVQATTPIGVSGNWSNIHLFFPDTTLSISYYGLDGWGIPFGFPMTLINGSQYSDPMIHLPDVYHHANITTTDYFGNVIAERIYQINATTVQYLNIPLQLVQVTLKGYELTMCNITQGSYLKTLSFDTSVTTFLKPGTYTFVGAAWSGLISFNLVNVAITTTVNRVIKLCNSPLIMTSVVFSQSDTSYSFSMSGNKLSPPFWFKVYDNLTLVVPTTYAFSGIWAKSAVYGWHNLTLQVGDDVGYTFNYTAAYFIGVRSVHFEFYSSIDGLGLDWNIAQLWVNGSRVFAQDYSTTGNHLGIQVKNYFGAIINSSTLPYAQVISIGLGLYNVNWINNGANPIIVNCTVAGSGKNYTLIIGQYSSVSWRMVAGSYTTYAFGVRADTTLVKFTEKVIVVAPSSTTFTYSDIQAPTTPVLQLPGNGNYADMFSNVFVWNDNASYISFFRLQVATSSSFTAGTVILNVSTVYFNYAWTLPTNSPLSPKTYYWWVQCVNIIGNQSAWSQVWSFQIQPVVTPVLQSPSNNAYGDIYLNNFAWASNTTHISYFLLQVSPSPTFATLTLNVSVAATNYLWTTPSPLSSPSYYWRVKVVNIIGNQSGWTPTWVFYLRVTPTTPVLQVPSNGAYGDFFTNTFIWADNSSYIWYFHLEASTSPSFTTLTLNTTTVYFNYQWVLPSNTPLTASSYHWRVRCVNVVGVISGWSQVWTLNMLPMTTPILISPGNNTYGDVNTNVFTWSDSDAYISYFQLEVSTGSGFTSLALNTTTRYFNYQWIVPSNSPLSLQWHYWRVRAVKVTGNVSAWSTTFSFYPSARAGAQVVYKNSHNAQVPALDPTYYLTKYYLPSVGVWQWLGSYSPSLVMLTSETGNFSVYDLFGNLVLDNYPAAYNTTIRLPLDVWNFQVFENVLTSTNMIYVNLTRGTATWTKHLYTNQIDWYPGAGPYNFSVYYYSIGKWFNMPIVLSSDFAMLMSDNATASLYSVQQYLNSMTISRMTSMRSSWKSMLRKPTRTRLTE